MSLHYAPYGGGEQLRKELIELAADRAFLGDEPAIRTRGAFVARLDAHWERIGPAMRDAGATIARILAARHAVALKLGDRPPPAWERAVADIREQLLYLLPRGFIVSTPYEQLRHVPRYLDAIIRRLDKLQNAGLTRDARWMADVAPLWRRYLDHLRANAGKPVGAPLIAYRWMIEEFRVSLFAQELGTAAPVSARKLEEQWARATAASA
jgi:ATP-dependent helicase HrpA